MVAQKYSVKLSPRFVDELNQIAQVIANNFGDPIAAEKFVDDASVAIEHRSYTAASFPIYTPQKERRFPYRYIVFRKKWLIFYRVVDSTMEVRRIIYGYRNIWSIMSE